MSKAPIIEHDTWLYSDAAPTGRLFGAGELHPGEGWQDMPSGANEGLGAAADAIEDAIADQKARFDTAWAELTTEHESVQAALTKAEAENKDLRGEIASKDEDIRQLKEAVAKFDPDGDGKPGGSVSKASK
jgi:hypothetical protein